MNAKGRIAGAVLAVGGITAGAILAAAPGASAWSGRAVVTDYVAKSTSQVFTNVGPDGPTVGTALHIAGELLKSGKQVGNLILVCEQESPGSTAELECWGTAWLGSGVNQISFTGYQLGNSAKSVYAVTGGTGSYIGASGEITTSRTATKGELEFALELT
jgi:hypothetical protein